MRALPGRGASYRAALSFSAMKWLQQLARSIAPPRRTDPRFGDLLYMGDKNRYWEGKSSFPPTGATVAYYIDGDADTDFSAQHANLDHIIARWQQLAHDLQPMLESSAVRENVPAKQFVVATVSLPDKPITAAPEWEIAFVGAGDAEQKVLFSAKMKGLAPIQIYVD